MFARHADVHPCAGHLRVDVFLQRAVGKRGGDKPLQRDAEQRIVRQRKYDNQTRIGGQQPQQQRDDRNRKQIDQRITSAGRLFWRYISQRIRGSLEGNPLKEAIILRLSTKSINNFVKKEFDTLLF